MFEYSSLCINIADIKIALETDDQKMRLGLEGAMKRFQIEEGASDVKVIVRRGNLPEKSIGKMIFDSGSLWKLYSRNGYYCFRFTSSVFGPRPYKTAFFNKGFHAGEVYLHYPYFNFDEAIYPLEYPLDELMIDNFLARGRGVEVHACGIVDSCGQGHLFVGQSTAGKSTMARLWEDEPGVIVLSDDRIILRKMENTIWMYGTPWHGDAGLASPVRTPLTAVYFLEKGQKQELIPQKPSDSISRLFACSFPPFYNHEAIDFTLGFLECVVRNVPCYELKFIPDKSVVELIQEERFT
jgi:hypothetical protein